jgi:hypothetical protein
MRIAAPFSFLNLSREGGRSPFGNRRCCDEIVINLRTQRQQMNRNGAYPLSCKRLKNQVE